MIVSLLGGLYKVDLKKIFIRPLLTIIEIKLCNIKQFLFIFILYLFRLTLLQDTHRSHLREYEKYIQDVKSSKSTIQNLENSSNQVLNFKFYKSMKVYVDNLIDCLNKKVHIYKYVIISFLWRNSLTM